jgi:hypothetical protein
MELSILLILWSLDMSNEIQSRQYKPQEEWCCEKCVFGTGDHDPDFCKIYLRELFSLGQENENI